MPALLIFNRRTIFAGDDLQPTAILTTMARLFQLVILTIPIIVHMTFETKFMLEISHLAHENDDTVDPKHKSLLQFLFGGRWIYPQEECASTCHFFPLLLYFYILFSMGHFLVSIFVEYVIHKSSSVGTPTEPFRRNPILSKVLERKWIFLSMLGNFIVVVFFFAAVFDFRKEYYECRAIKIDELTEDGVDVKDAFPSLLGKNGWWIALFILVGSQCIELFVSSWTLISFLRKPTSKRYDTAWEQRMSNMDMLQHSYHYHELAEEMWDQRCRNFCQCASRATCFLFGGRDLVDDIVGDYGQVARALADYFEDGGVLDIVASDIAAGFMMLQKEQRLRLLEAREEILEQTRHKNAQMKIEGCPSPASSSTSFQSAVTEVQPTFISERLHFDHDDHEFEDSFSNTQTSLFRDQAMLDSALSPLPFSSMFVLPDEPPDMFSLDNWNHISSVFTMKINANNEELSPRYEAHERKVFNRNNEYDRSVIAEGARFSRHALSIYSWMLLVYMEPIKSIPKLTYTRLKDCFQDKTENDLNGEPYNFFSTSDNNIDTDNILGDNWFHIHRNSLLAHAGLDQSDLIYANFSNKYNHMPYCIVIDHKWQSVVLSVRGTLSLEDCVVDVLVEPESLDELGVQYGFDASDQYCHSGVLACVKQIGKELDQHKVLDKLLAGPNAKFPNFMLRIVGHSLGAGCATILGYMLRARFPGLRVTAISPPGGFLSEKLAIGCKDFVTSFVLDSDLVPRLSVKTMEHMRDEVLRLIGRIKVPKMEVAKTFVVNGILCRDRAERDDIELIREENQRLLYDNESVPIDSEFWIQMERFELIQAERKLKRGEVRSIDLFPPGKIVHLMKTGERKSCVHSLKKCVTCFSSNAGYEYSPVWLQNDDLNEIVISPTMGFDHFPNRVCLELERVARGFGIDTSPGSTLDDKKEAQRAVNGKLGPF